jgi:hypothetical protein
MKKVLICQLGAYGDCLQATTIARQIKHDDPRCELTWAIGSNYADILVGNPDVDQVWTYPIKDRWEVTSKWFKFVKDVETVSSKYDAIYFTQTYPGNADRFYGCAREAMFRAYPKPITVSLEPVIRLSPIEIERVRAFANTYGLPRFTDNKTDFEYYEVILFECTPQSNQSFLTLDMAAELATDIVKKFPRTCVIIAGSKDALQGFPFRKGVIDGSVLSFREMAELTNYCTLFIGTGSGITQICQSDWADPLPTVQLLTQGTISSLIADHDWFHLDTDAIIELVDVSEIDVINCIDNIFENGFTTAKSVYRKPVVPDFTAIRFHMMFESARLQGHLFAIIPALIKTIRDYGMTTGLINFFMSFPESIMKLAIYRWRGVK